VRVVQTVFESSNLDSRLSVIGYYYPVITETSGTPSRSSSTELSTLVIFYAYLNSAISSCAWHFDTSKIMRHTMRISKILTATMRKTHFHSGFYFGFVYAFIDSKLNSSSCPSISLNSLISFRLCNSRRTFSYFWRSEPRVALSSWTSSLRCSTSFWFEGFFSSIWAARSLIWAIYRSLSLRRDLIFASFSLTWDLNFRIRESRDEAPSWFFIWTESRSAIHCRISVFRSPSSLSYSINFCLYFPYLTTVLRSYPNLTDCSANYFFYWASFRFIFSIAAVRRSISFTC